MKRSKILKLVAIFSILVGIIIGYPSIFSALNKSNVKADIPRVKGASDNNYDYEFFASSYKVQMGKSGGKPNVLVTQNSRQMDITFLEGPENQKKDNSGQKVDNQEKATDSASIQQTDASSSSSLVPMLTPTITPFPTPTDQPVSEVLRSNFNSELNAQTQVSTSSGDIQAVQSNNESYVYYQSEELKVDPKLDKVGLEKKVQKGFDLPSLYLTLTKLTPENDPDGSLVIKTRTGRKAFSISDVKLTDANGITQAVKVTLSNAGGSDYLVSFDGASSWLNDPARAYPLTVNLNLASLFSDKMLPFWPKTSDFKAFEPAEFEVDTAIITDENIKKALLTENLDGLKLGTINAKGEQKVLDAKVVARDGDKVTIDITNPDFKPGIFDLLIQYQDNPAYVAQDDFSWGVLAINPDMAVYPPKSTAKLDLAVLDKYGEMVCDADLLLTVEAPDGTVTERSTLDGSIKVSDTCWILMTNKPDYSTTYKTGGNGEYKMTLSAITKDGTFVLNDSFWVDSNSPFYVKRLGPTRIYPVLTYNMQLEITSATDSGTYDIREEVPDGFELTNINANVEPLSNRKNVTWEEYMTKGQKKVLSYTFDAPDVSPELFLIGPLKIQSVATNSEIYNENRQWQIASDAIGIENLGSCTISGSTSCSTPASITVTSANLLIVQITTAAGNSVSSCSGAGGSFTNTNATYGSTGDAPLIGQWYRSSPSTGAQTVNCTLGGSDKGIIHVFGLTGVDLSSPGPVDTTSFTGATANLASSNSATITTDQANSWMITGITYTDSGTVSSYGSGQTQIAQTNANITGQKITLASTYELKAASGSPGDAQSASWTKSSDTAISVIEVVEASAAGGPTTDQVMRHGNWFTGGAEQYFYWAN